MSVRGDLKELDSLTKYLVDRPWDKDTVKVSRYHELKARYPQHHYGSPV